MARRAMASRESVAYKEAYYQDTAAPHSRMAQQAKLRVISSKKKKRTRLQPIACFILLVAIANLILYSQMTLTRLTREVSQSQQQLTDLENEYIALKASKDRILSLGYVEEYAQDKLGMMKMDSSRVEYIEMNNPDRIEVSRQHSSLGYAMSQLTKSFSAILEYLG